MNDMRKIRRMILAAAILLTAALLATAAYADGITADIRPAEERDYSGYTVILHSNDVHGAVDGYAKIAWLRTQLEDMGAEVILADAGDFSQGGAAVNMNKGADAVRLMNAAGYDIAAVGNHEFDFGPERMMENLGGAEFTVVCSNILKDGEPVFAPSAMYETESGLKIGFFGVETPETLTKSNPNNTARYTILGGEDMYAAAQAETDALISDGADIVIALTHLGVDAESVNSGNGSPNLCAGVSGIDLMIDGHSHTVMTSGADGEPIQSTGTKFAYIGLVLISPEGVIEDRYLVPTDDLGSDEDVAAATQVISDALDETYGEVIAVCETDITGEKNDNRCHESNNGDLTCDAFLWYAENFIELSDYDREHMAAIMNGGGIRAGLVPGDVTKMNVFEIHPFSNTLVLVRLTGAELLEGLEASTFSTPEPVGAYPQTSGIIFTVDTGKEYAAGELYPDSVYHRPSEIRRVTIESVCGQPFDPDAVYTVVCSNFLTDGGDTYYVFSHKEYIDTGVLLDEVVIRYITEALGGVITADQYGQPCGAQTIIIPDAAEDEAELVPAADETEPEPEAAVATDVAAAEADGPDETVYIVLPGDCLWNIAGSVYGDSARWTDIYRANSGVISDPALIYPGQGLTIPAA